jgi:hypothetical protein
VRSAQISLTSQAVSSLTSDAEDPETDDMAQIDSKQGSHDRKKDGKVIGYEHS